MNTKDKILKAKVQLIIKSPFFASIVMKKPVNLVEGIKTARTNGQQIEVGTEAAESWTVEELTGVLAHEALHIANGHHLRIGSREPKKWNHAADYAINPLLSDFTLPGSPLINPAYDNMSAEAIYATFPEDENGQDGPGDVEPAPMPQGQTPEQVEQQWKSEVSAAYHAAKMAGNVPAWLDRLIEEILPAQVNWVEVLAAYLKEHTGKSDYSWKQPNTRYLHAGFYLPALCMDKGATIAVMVDTSGSISQSILDTFAAEVNGICKEARLNAHVIYCDTEVTDTQYFTPEDDITLSAKGGGGTDFKPPFEHLENEGIQPDAIVYLTDGYCSSFPESSPATVLWVLTEKNNSFNPPLGETILIQ